MHPRLIELEKLFKPSPVTQLFDPLLEDKKIELWIKRDDLIHPVISGNKWRKLKYILNHALTIGSDTIISMGGAYSNHLHALAFAGKQLEINTIAYVRGERPESFNPTLEDLYLWGMELRFISRTEYKQLRNYKGYSDLPGILKGEYWLPEGGSTELALRGVGEIFSGCEIGFDIICVPCGTGTTLAGLITSVPANHKMFGFSALKGAAFLTQDVEKLLSAINSPKANWTIQLDYHFGGFAKCNNDLLLFIKQFFEKHDIELEPVYTGKMFYGVLDLIQQGYFEPGTKILAIHTGGLQGNRK
ncbi:MAG: pyridoxal-phosphate dependent enzyme [Methylococcaceae bacterium]|nr:pyridoxal-phosphate dependent enzyme [Methylococcaceae bacterium]